jgi:DNA-binding transcriptional regulator YhcF (GntR family)
MTAFSFSLKGDAHAEAGKVRCRRLSTGQLDRGPHRPLLVFSYYPLPRSSLLLLLTARHSSQIARRLLHYQYNRFEGICDLLHHSCEESASRASAWGGATTRVGRTAVVEELRDRIVTGLHVGRLRGGERLPAVRALAAEFDVNERVVLGALRLLANEGFIDLRPRSGAYVAPPHPAGGDALPHVGAWLVSVLVQARARGIPPRRLADYMRRYLETRRVRAACVECNQDQLHLLCSELSEDHGYITDSTPLDELNPLNPPASVRRADVLITTSFHADRVRAVATRLGKPWIAVGLRPDVMRTVGQHLREGQVYYVATDPRFEKKLRRMLAPFGPISNLRVRVLDRDELSDIPDSAPTFVMTSARDRVRKLYGRRGGPGRPIHPPRHFSDDAARELLAFLVRANLEALFAARAVTRSS